MTIRGVNSKEVERVLQVLQGLVQNLEDIVSSAEEYAGGRSDRWAESEAGERFQEVLEYLAGARDALQEAQTNMEEAQMVGS
jgi:hypothetical protein